MKHKDLSQAVRAFYVVFNERHRLPRWCHRSLGCTLQHVPPALRLFPPDKGQTPGLVCFHFPTSTPMHTDLPLCFSSPLLLHLPSFLPLLTFQVGPAYPNTPDVLKEF